MRLQLDLAKKLHEEIKGALERYFSSCMIADADPKTSLIAAAGTVTFVAAELETIMSGLELVGEVTALRADYARLVKDLQAIAAAKRQRKES